MSLVPLVSGGVDSTLMTLLAHEAGLAPRPLFVDYGQRFCEREWAACEELHARLNLPKPARMDLSGFGQLVRTGLTDTALRVNEDAFTPGRNLLFLLVGAAYAYQNGDRAVGIGLLREEDHLFPDQTEAFLRQAEGVVRFAMGFDVTFVAPLMAYSKAEVLSLAEWRGLDGTYSCHAGGSRPCGTCISCVEARRAREESTQTQEAIDGR